MEDDDRADSDEFIDPHDWVDDLPRAYHNILPPLGVQHPSLFKPRRNQADLHFTDRTASRDDGRRAPGPKVTYLHRFKAKKALTCAKQVAERLIYSRVFDPA
eukprot:jgi/Tetstr1/443892/TSEL_031844.t1